MSKTITVTLSELSAILAGLRLLQINHGRLSPAVEAIENCGGDVEPMTDRQIDTLGERINTGE